MSKAQFYDPKQLRAPGEIHFQDIDVCKYQKTVADELKGDSFTKEDMLRIYRDMEYIREFESMLKSVRLTKAYNGVEYTYTGPAHLYTGEESAAVGQSYLLDSNDFIFGTHRSHGEVLAKGLSAITKMSDEELLHIMETTFDGKPYEVVKKHLPEKSVKEQAIVFFLYGLTCELFGRENGFARGLGNSMHLFFLPFGIYPNNAIVGGSPCIAAGAALYKKNMKAPGVVIANGGDGSLGCGPVWEALNFSAMDQLKTLWPDEYKGGLPVIFNFMDNGYGMGGRTNGETMAYGQLARVGAGITENQMNAERVDGVNDDLAQDQIDSRADTAADADATEQSAAAPKKTFAITDTEQAAKYIGDSCAGALLDAWRAFAAEKEGGADADSALFSRDHVTHNDDGTVTFTVWMPSSQKTYRGVADMAAGSVSFSE